MENEFSSALILIPSYQPEEILFSLTKGLNEIGFRVLVINDGSEDKYQPIFDQCKAYATLISHDHNLGKGAALKSGFKYILDKMSDVKYVITVDGDGQHCIKDIVRVFSKLVQTNMCIVGERRFDCKTPLKSKIGNELSRFSQSLATLRYMNDNQCGLRGFPFSLLPELINISGRRYEYEMRVLNYLQMKEINYQTIFIKTIYEDNNSKTHFKPLLDTFLIQKSIFTYGLVSIIALLINIVVTTLLYELVFKSIGIYPISFPYEASIFIGSISTLLIHIALCGIIFKPKNAGKMILRLVLYSLIMLISNIISTLLFSRILNLPIYLSLIFSILLTIIPMFYLIKGIGLVYTSQNE